MKMHVILNLEVLSQCRASNGGISNNRSQLNRWFSQKDMQAGKQNTLKNISRN